jgi:hypothetical protein
VRWGSNNYHQDHPFFAEYMNKRLTSGLDSSQRERLVKDWEDVMIHDLNPLREHAMNTSFGDGETFGNLQLEFNMWVRSYYLNTHIYCHMLCFCLEKIYLTDAWLIWFSGRGCRNPPRTSLQTQAMLRSGRSPSALCSSPSMPF